MNDGDAQLAGVAIPPPLLFGTALALGLALGRSASAERVAAGARVMGTAAMAAGVAIGGAALATLKRAGTNVDPYKPSTALVTDGIFRWTRNPAYVGATSIYLGVAMRAGSLPALVLLPVVLALLDHGVVDREERYLERRFGEPYRAYRERVPRWF